MKLLIKSTLGKSQSVDVSPTDTFADLQKRTLEETGCHLELEHLKCKTEEIQEEYNVVEYYKRSLLSEAEDLEELNSEAPSESTVGCSKKDTTDINTVLGNCWDNLLDDDVSEHPGQLCRLCALPRKTMVYIFSEQGHQLGLRSKINTWLPTHVSRTDPLPKQICVPCIEKLNICQEFGTDCMKAEQTLSSLFKSRKFGCHIKPVEAASLPVHESDTSGEASEIKQSSELNCKTEDCNDESTNNSESLMETIRKDVTSSDNRTIDKHSTEVESIIPENESDLDSDDSSESELTEMIFGDVFQEECKTFAPTNYCCPLCCEGRMVKLNHTDKESLNSSIKFSSKKLDLLQSELSGSVSDLDNRLNSDNFNLDRVDLEDSSHLKQDHGSGDKENSLQKCNNDMGMSGDSDSLALLSNFSNMKDDDRSQGGGTDCDMNNEETSCAESKMEENVVTTSGRGIDKSVNCFVCGVTVKSMNNCLVHALNAHVDTEKSLFPCSQCEKCFSAHTDLTRHFFTIHQNIKAARLLHVCHVCGRCCASQRALENHLCIPLDSSADKLACKMCGLSFSTKARLAFHSQFHDPTGQDVIKQSFECISCRMVFTEEDNFYDHVRFSHRGQVFVCRECGKYFSSKTSLQGHMRSHQNLRIHACEICKKNFLDKQTLKEHLVSHMDVKPFQCHICGKYLNRNSRLKKHLMSHELEKKTEPQECFQCVTCGEVFPNESRSIIHAQIGHSDGPSGADCLFQLCSLNKIYRCEFCERCYGQPVFLNTHRLIHRDESLPYKCHICGTGFSTFARCATHKVTHGIYEKKDDFSVPKFFLCDECDKSYLHWTYLSVHRKMIHAQVKHMYKCKECPEQFINSWGLAYHRKTRHGEGAALDGSLPASERKRWKCEYCEKRYISHQSMLAHVHLLHTGDNPGPSFQCDECGKRFARKLSLESHQKMHTGSKPFICPICNKSFVHSSGLSSHLRRHKGDRPHSCEYCSKTFLQRGDRDDHVRKHTGEKPFRCQHCPKAFRTRAMWFEHNRIHRDERPFPCDICGAAFRRSYALKNHKTIHTGERPHVCKVCGKGFRQKQDMQKHVKVHHPFEIQEQVDEREIITIVQAE